jgi:hypothetical protein
VGGFLVADPNVRTVPTDELLRRGDEDVELRYGPVVLLMDDGSAAGS